MAEENKNPQNENPANPTPTPSAAAVAPQRRGFKTTEWWLSFLTAAIGLAIMGGYIDVKDGVTTVDKIAGLAVAALASLGYSVSRGLAKHGGDSTK